MIVCGIKLSHDAGVAVVKNGVLICSIELEKVLNNKRHKEITTINEISHLLKIIEVDIQDIDIFVIDGWHDEVAGELPTTITLNDEYQADLKTFLVAPYCAQAIEDSMFAKIVHGEFRIGNKCIPYVSYYHVLGHILGAWCTSPFSIRNNNSYALVWDGGMEPRLYYIDAVSKEVKSQGSVHSLIGDIYSNFAQHYAPFNQSKSLIEDDFSIPGKLMAYIAFGKPQKIVIDALNYAYTLYYKQIHQLPLRQKSNTFIKIFHDNYSSYQFCDEDILASFHYFVEQLLVDELGRLLINIGESNPIQLCYSGGCALNIKWNNRLRESDFISELWIPPFPNDSGSALGMACTFLFHKNYMSALKWNAFSGPEVVPNRDIPEGWKSRPCDIKKLAGLLYYNDEPIVILTGRAELGPRALGHRSIISSPLSKQMKKKLNSIKARENYRPVAPICLENRAMDIFDPGCSDPFMLFEHKVKEEWKHKIPAVVHIDGTARLQTINEKQCHFIASLLIEFEKLCGVPVLCNTSANYNGKGFFPDVLSVIQWGKISYIWCDGYLISRNS